MRMIKYLKIHLKISIFLFLVIISGTVVEIAIPFMYQGVFDRGILKNNVRQIIFWLALMIVFTILNELFNLFQTIMSANLKEKVFGDIKSDVYKHLQNMSLSYYSKTQSGNLVSKIMNDVDALEHLLTNNILILFKNILMITIITIILFTFDYKMALLALLFIPIFILFFKNYKKSVYDLSIQSVEKLENLTGSLQEGLNAVETIQLFDSENNNIKNTIKKINDSENSKRLLKIKRALAGSCSVLISVFSLLLLWGYGSYEVTSGKLTIGILISISYYIKNLLDYMNDAFNLVTNMQISLPSAKRVFEILDTNSDIIENENAIELKEVKESCTFENVYFGYSADNYILKNINLSFTLGSITAFVGESGQGKSSFAKLIPRHYDPLTGNILIDGINIKNIKLQSLRKNVAIITQETFLFNDSIKNNITLGRQNVSLEEIVHAAQTANAHDFITALPDGYNSIVGERGFTLSGGQKKRIAIARALLSDPPIIILDEATADLDEYNERVILSSFKKISKEKIVIMITHKMSNLSYAHRILSLLDGNIYEYEELEAYETSLIT